MGYRNDRDAAFERAEALAAEVDLKAETIAEKERQIALLRAEIEEAKSRPLSLAELEAKDEGRAEGRRHVLRGITLAVGILFLLSSGLTAAAGAASYLVNRSPPSQYATLVRATGEVELESLAVAADWLTFVTTSAMTLALMGISVGMIGRARWSAWAGAAWAGVAIALCIASGLMGARIMGTTAWVGALFGTVGPIVLGLYSGLRIRYELR